MQIKQDLPQFEGKKVLIVVTGELMAEFYLARNGNIELLDRFAVANPRAKLREDYVDTTKLWISGSMYDGAKEEVQRKMLRQLKQVVERMNQKHQSTDIYIFSLDHMKKMVAESIPNSMKSQVRLEYPGNFLNSHPFKILQIIKDVEDEKRDRSQVLTPEEIEILYGHFADEHMHGK